MRGVDTSTEAQGCGPECAPPGEPETPDVRARALAFKALGDPTRLRMLRMIAAAGELCACHVEAGFDLSQPTISHHLKVLRRAGLIVGERRGTWIHYAVDAARLAELRAALEL